MSAGTPLNKDEDAVVRVLTIAEYAMSFKALSRAVGPITDERLKEILVDLKNTDAVWYDDNPPFSRIYWRKSG